MWVAVGSVAAGPVAHPYLDNQIDFVADLAGIGYIQLSFDGG